MADTMGTISFPVSEVRSLSAIDLPMGNCGNTTNQKTIGKGMVITLIILLIILLGVLGATIFFKEQIINFFNGA